MGHQALRSDCIYCRKGDVKAVHRFHEKDSFYKTHCNTYYSRTQGRFADYCRFWWKYDTGIRSAR